MVIVLFWKPINPSRPHSLIVWYFNVQGLLPHSYHDKPMARTTRTIIEYPDRLCPHCQRVRKCFLCVAQPAFKYYHLVKDRVEHQQDDASGTAYRWSSGSNGDPAKVQPLVRVGGAVLLQKKKLVERANRLCCSTDQGTQELLRLKVDILRTGLEWVARDRVNVLRCQIKKL